jgi:hypothetical protein
VLFRDGRRKPVIGKPSEFDRLLISSQIVPDYFAALNGLLGRVPDEVLWKMDKPGHTDWPDVHPETVYVPIEFEADSVPIPVSRTASVWHQLIAFVLTEPF